MKNQMFGRVILQMRRVFIKGLVVVMLFAFGLQTACNSKPTDKKVETVTLKLAHFFPATHPAETEWVTGWAEAIKEATDGKVIIESYPGESLLKASDTYNNVIKGVSDIGLSCFSYNKGRFPILEAFEQPGIIYKNSKVASMVA